MPSLVEKYRPKRLEDLVGESPTAVAGMVRMWKNDGGISSMPNLLFYGPPGAGKTTTALCLVNELECDYIEVNASDDRGIDSMRKIVQTTRYKAINPIGGKIVILDEADGITHEAQAMLRRPMEKSGETRFIIIANEIRNIISPIISRCVTFEFTLFFEDIKRRINKIVNLEGMDVDEYMIEDVARESNGDLRRAIGKLEKIAIVENLKLNEIVRQYSQ
jgi:DNA polymerase III delta prime subunit